MIGIERPLPLEDALVFVLGKDLLIYPGHGRAVVKLDPFARAVWELCDGRRTVHEISLALGKERAEDRIFRDVERAVARFVDEGLMETSGDGEALSLEGEAEQSVGIVFDRQRVVVACEDEEILAGVAGRLRHLIEAERNRLIETIQRFRLVREGGRFLLLQSGEIVRVDGRLESCLRFLEGEIVRTFMAARNDLLWLHAGGAVRDGRAVLFCGVAGRGKSTLVTGLVEERGWLYLSDETVPVRAGKAQAFPRTPVVREAVPEASAKLSEESFHSLRRLEIEIAEHRVAREEMEIGALVFPRFTPDEKTRLLEEPPADAALELLENCFSFKKRGEESVREVVDLVRSLPCFKLCYADGREAVDLIDRAVEHWYFEG